MEPPVAGFESGLLHVPRRNLSVLDRARAFPRVSRGRAPRRWSAGGATAKKPGVNRIARLVASLLLLIPLWACGKKIGDQCQTQFDCNDEDDSRTCDISQPGGYCTVEGCDERSCPGEAVCIRFFPRTELLTRVCNPRSPDRGASECGADDLCLDAGRCAPRATELRRCMLRCGDSGDCRDDYRCKVVGGEPPDQLATENGVPLTAIPLTPKRYDKVGYCAPRN